MKRMISIVSIFLFATGLHAQSGETILSKHFETYGQSIWDQIESVIVDGSWVTEDFKNYPIKITYKRPEKIRIAGLWNNKRFAEVSNGSLAWIVAPWTGSSKPQLMTLLEQLIITNAYNLGSPLRIHEKELAFNGLGNFKGELYLHFSFESPYVRKDFYLGQDDLKVYWETVETKAGNKKFRVEKQFEKYKTYNTLLVPTAVRMYTELGERELIFDDVTIGAGAPNKIFEMPKTED